MNISDLIFFIARCSTVLASELPEGKIKLKGHKFGFLKKGTSCNEVVASQFTQIHQPMLWIWLGENLAYEHLQYFQNLEMLCNLFQNVIISNSGPMKNHPNFTRALHLCEVTLVIGNRFVCSIHSFVQNISSCESQEHWILFVDNLRSKSPTGSILVPLYT